MNGRKEMGHSGYNPTHGIYRNAVYNWIRGPPCTEPTPPSMVMIYHLAHTSEKIIWILKMDPCKRRVLHTTYLFR